MFPSALIFTLTWEILYLPSGGGEVGAWRIYYTFYAAKLSCRESFPFWCGERQQHIPGCVWEREKWTFFSGSKGWGLSKRLKGIAEGGGRKGVDFWKSFRRQVLESCVSFSSSLDSRIRAGGTFLVLPNLRNTSLPHPRNIRSLTS